MRRTMGTALVLATCGCCLETSIVSLDLPMRGDFSIAGRCWRWKSLVLGDDLGLPRRRAAAAVAALAMKRDGVSECAVLSTCARLDFLLRTESSEVAMDAIADVLGRQVAQLNVWTSGLRCVAAWLDAAESKITQADSSEPMDVRDALTPRLGIQVAAHHLCLVATAAHDFDPFCSRRAHVMHQLKSCSSSKSFKALVDAALNAGKTARDPNAPSNVALKARPHDPLAREAAANYARKVAAESADRLCREELLKPLVVHFRTRAQRRIEPVLQAQPHLRPKFNRRLHAATIEIRRDPSHYSQHSRELDRLLDATLQETQHTD